MVEVGGVVASTGHAVVVPAAGCDPAPLDAWEIDGYGAAHFPLLTLDRGIGGLAEIGIETDGSGHLPVGSVQLVVPRSDR